METNILRNEGLQQEKERIQKKKRIKKRKRKIVRRVFLAQLVFLAIASHYAKAEPIGIMKYYSIELATSILILLMLMKIKENFDGKNKSVVLEKKDEDIEERPIEREEYKSYNYNYNWVIKNTDKEKELIDMKEYNDVKKKSTEKMPDGEKVIYKSPFETSINTDKDRKIAYKSPFEPLHEGKVVLELETSIEKFKYSLNTKDKYKSRKYKEIDSSKSVDICFDTVCEKNNIEEEPSIKEANILAIPQKEETTKAQEIEPQIKEVKKHCVRLKTEDLHNKKTKSNGKYYKKRIELTETKPRELDKISYEGEYNFPTLDLLDDNIYENEIDYKKDGEKGQKLIETLASFNVRASIANISHGSSVTRYEILPDAGVKVSKIVNLQDDIALALAATGVRIAPVAGKSVIGIEVPNEKVIPVYLKEVLSSKEFINHKSNLAFGLGKEVTGNIKIGDIEKMPHVLIAGATGSGKSVCLNSIIISVLYKASPKDVRMLMIDPKVVEMSVYNGIPHLLIPVVTEPKKAIGALNWAVLEMESRYLMFANEKVRDLKGYNKIMEERGEEKLPQILIIVDELADLMMVSPHEIEASITRLAQKSRACGIHLVIATQRPSVDVITGLIKANVPSRISFAVASQIDSRTILDMSGAEKLLGRGDMLYNPVGVLKPIRVQGAFLKDKEVYNVVSFIKNNSEPEYQESLFEIIDKEDEKEEEEDDKKGSNEKEEDELLRQVIDMVLDYEQASASFIQRKFKVGYARAARILDQMEEWGIVAKAEGSKARQILTTKEEWQELNM